MSPAYLHVVPDPEPEEAPGPGERPVLVPAVPRPRPVPELDADTCNSSSDVTAVQAPAEAVEELLQDQAVEPTADPGEEVYEEEPEEDVEEDAAPRGYMTLPDLRPYIDPRPLTALGPLAKEAAPPLGRALARLLRVIGRGLHEVGRMLAWYARGIGVLLVLLTGWLSGKYGKHGSIGARAGAAGFLAYVAFKLSGDYPLTPWVLLAVALTAVVLAATGKIEIPVSKPAKKEAGKGETKGKGKGAKGAGTSSKGKTAPAGKGAKEEPEEGDEDGPEVLPDVAKEKPAEAPRGGWMARLLRRPESPTEESAGSPAEGSEESPEEAEEELPEEADGGDEEAPVEPSPDPSREDVIEALHHLYAGGSGVLLTLLSEHLGTADTRALKRVLGEVAIPHRTGVRTPAGNGPGVHREDIPPLPPSLGLPQGAVVVAGQEPTPTPTTLSALLGEGLAAYGTHWTLEERARGFRSVPDPERGPSASKIERWEEG